VVNELNDKVVLITGAGLGFGRDLAEAFAAQGAIVAAIDLTPINLDETVHRIRSSGGVAQAYVADIASKLALQTVLNEIVDQYGRIDILIQTAGVDPSDQILEIDEWDWRRTLDINLTGPFLLLQSVGRIMREQGGGIIVNVITFDEQRHVAIASKTGLIALTRSAAAEFETYNIQINALVSGDVELQHNPTMPEDPIELVLYLCSSAAAKIHEQVFQVNI
jgi:NAD(P)-dependent dehydrogenase (short-subunit alcohol dehydrogenase family)